MDRQNKIYVMRLRTEEYIDVNRYKQIDKRSDGELKDHRNKIWYIQSDKNRSS